MSVPGGTRSTPGTMPPRQAPGPGRPPGQPGGLAGGVGGAGDRRPVPAGAPGRPRLTGRGATLLMLAVFLIGNLIAAAADAPWLAGLSYAAGCLLSVTYARREALPLVVTTPPLIFLIALLSAELITAGGSTALATAEGTMLTLAAVAPWLFACTAGCVAVAMVRGLPRCIRDLRAELNGRPKATGGGASGPAPF